MAPQRYAPLARKTRSPLAVQGIKNPLQAARVPRFSVNPPARRPARLQTPDYVPYARRERRQTEREQASPSSQDRRWPQFSTEYRDIYDQVYDDQDVDEPQKEQDFPWEDEKTLVSDLMHDGTVDQSEDSKLSSLVESIKDSFSLYSKELIDDIADTLVPVVNHVKHAHGVLNGEMDVSFAEGLQDFDRGCRAMEENTTMENDRVKEVYHESQTRIKELFKRLHATYQRRDQLWKDLETALNETINPSLSSLKGLPADVERTIANLEKQSKQIAQKDNVGTEKVLKSLLSKFT
ncbi:hypothetical protein V5O48_004112 [Marasmius crinis-equi]|uniref:Uncharacterized protein n=1 Tax=Marasmius crinis-equi TaxID=585013 RepID=A0ABR3FR05_9AGAR